MLKRGILERRWLIGKILVALDGSEASNRALDLALDIAEKYSAEILLLTVIQPVTIPFYVFEGVPTPIGSEFDTYFERVQAYSNKILSEALNRAKREKPKLKIYTKLEEGRPAKADESHISATGRIVDTMPYGRKVLDCDGKRVVVRPEWIER